MPRLRCRRLHRGHSTVRAAPPRPLRRKPVRNRDDALTTELFALPLRPPPLPKLRDLVLPDAVPHLLNDAVRKSRIRDEPRQPGLDDDPKRRAIDARALHDVVDLPEQRRRRSTGSETTLAAFDDEYAELVRTAKHDPRDERDHDEKS